MSDVKVESPAAASYADHAVPETDAAAKLSIPRHVWLSLAALVLGYLPLLVLFFRRLWLSDHYGFFPLVLVAFGVLLYQRADLRRLIEHATWGWRDLIWFGSAWGLLALAVWLWSPWIAGVSAILAIGGVLWRMRQGWELVPPWLLLWLIVPLPLNMDTRLVLSLQGLSSRAGSYVLDALRYNHVLNAHVIEVPGHKFMVEEACSGIRSLFVLIACAAIFVVWQRRGIVHSILLLAAAVFWATTLNVVRVTAVVLFQMEWSVDISTGWKHELLGCILFALALYMLWCTDRLLEFFLEPIPREVWGEDEEDVLSEEAEQELDEATPQVELISPQPAPVFARAESHASRSRTSLIVACGLFPILGLAQLILHGESFRDIPADAAHVQRIAATMEESALPEEIAPWKRSSYETAHRDTSSIYGEFSRTWTYEQGDTRAVVSLDFPFLGWHELTQCYILQGWEIGSRELLVQPVGDGTDVTIEVFELHQPTGEKALLLLTHFDHQGRPLSAPDELLTQSTSWTQRLARRLSRAMNSVGVIQNTYQVQLFLPRGGAVTSADRDQALRLFQEVRNQLQQGLAQELTRDG